MYINIMISGYAKVQVHLSLFVLVKLSPGPISYFEKPFVLQSDSWVVMTRLACRQHIK